MFGDQQGVSPFGTSILDLSAKTNFGVPITNRSGVALARGSVLMPAYGSADPEVDITHDYELDGIYRSGVAPASLYHAANGWQNGTGPFAITTNDATKPDVADGEIVRVFNGGVTGAFIEVLIEYDWGTALAEGTLLCPIAGEVHLIPALIPTATHGRPIARVMKNIPLDTLDTGVSVQLVKVFFRGLYGV